MPIAQNDYYVVSMEEQYTQESFRELTIDQNKEYQFSFCKFDNVHFSDEQRISSLAYCEFRNCTFENFYSKNLDVKLANFYDCSFNSSDLSNANFGSAGIHYSKFENTNLSDASFVGATIKGSNFIRSELSGVNFSAVKIDSVYANDCIINKPVYGLYENNITMGGATQMELEQHRSHLLNALGIGSAKKFNPTQLQINLVADYESKFDIPQTDRITEWFGDYGMNVIKPGVSEDTFLKHYKAAAEYELPPRRQAAFNVSHSYDYYKRELNASKNNLERMGAWIDLAKNDPQIKAEEYHDLFKTAQSFYKAQTEHAFDQEQHLDKLKAIAEYEQRLNVSPEERIAEMNYSTAHWQPKDGVTPDQAEALYDYITNKQHIGFDEVNRIRMDARNLPITADKYYQNVKYMAFVSRFDFGSENSINIESIKIALNEVPYEYVLSKMTKEQCDLFTEYYEANMDSAGTEGKQLYDAIINIRKNDLSISNEPLENRVDPSLEPKRELTPENQMQIYEVAFDDDNYLHFCVEADGYQLEGLFCVHDPANGPDMNLVSIGYGYMHSQIKDNWDNIERQCQEASLERYKELTGHDFSFSNEMLESKVDPMLEMKNDFSKSIDDFINGKINPSTQIFVCKTTDVMKACGADDLDVVINQSSIRKILSDDKEKFPHAHNLSVQELKQLPEQLQKPIMTLKGSHDNSMVLVTDIRDINSKEVLITVDIDTAGFNQNVNRITSMYGKDNITNYLRNQLDKGNLIGCDKKRANEMLSIKGLQLPPTTTFIDYTDIISKVEADVNNKISPNITPSEQLSLFGVEAKKTPALETEKTTASKALTKEEFDKLTSEMKDIAKTYAADPELFTEYMAFKAQFYQYSPTNAMLIHLQNPYATFVASFAKWKEMGYKIKPGQHHIKISRPIEISKFPKEINGKTVWTDVKYANPEEKAKIANGELEIRKTKKFIPHRVFDISQTNCPADHYPKIYNMGHPDIEQKQLYECIKEYAKISGFTVTEEDLSSIALKGYYNRADDTIHINSLLEDSGRLEVMCHELAHGILHKTSTQPTEIKEFEAECFASMLKRKMGFPVSEESKRYISQYYNKIGAKNIGKFDMNKTLDRLSKAFNHTSKGIDETISNMGFAQEKELAHTLAQANGKAVDVSKISENFTQALQ